MTSAPMGWNYARWGKYIRILTFFFLPHDNYLTFLFTQLVNFCYKDYWLPSVFFNFFFRQWRITPCRSLSSVEYNFSGLRIMIKKNAYALKTPHVAFLPVICLSFFFGRSIDKLQLFLSYGKSNTNNGLTDRQSVKAICITLWKIILYSQLTFSPLSFF